MDERRFDELARTVGDGTTRRAFARLLTALPVGGALATLLGDEGEAKDEVGGEGRRRRRKARHDAGERKEKRQRRRKRRRNRNRGGEPGCQPESAAQTCAGRCGTVTNSCGEGVDCGPCVCEPACPVCQRCDAATGQCVPDPATVGQACGGPGEVCQANGACSCTVCASGCPFTTLQAAVDAAQPGATLTICPGGLTGASAQARIGKDLTLRGLGADQTTLDATGAAGPPVIEVAAGATVAIEGITITGGRPDLQTNQRAGGVINAGTLTLTGCVITDNQSAYYGGGIYNADTGTLIMEGGGVTENVASFSGGIHNEGGELTLHDVDVTGNMSTGGGGVVTRNGKALITGGSVSENVAMQFGGGIASYGAEMTLDSVAIENNGVLIVEGTEMVVQEGGGLYLESSLVEIRNGSVSDNSALQFGGGIRNKDGRLTLDASSVTLNTVSSPTGSGGGIFNSGTGTVELLNNSEVAYNTPDDCAGTTAC